MKLKTLITAATVACFALGASAKDGDSVINYEQLDAQMNAAQDEARAYLDTFFANILDENGFSQDGSGVKVAFPIGGDSVEVIWVSPFGQRDGQFIGVLANRPRDIEGYSVGDTITFERDQIRDWYVFGPNGKMFGSYTTRVMLADMSADAAAQLAEMLANPPVPADW